jgi:hypothetical protein
LCFAAALASAGIGAGRAAFACTGDDFAKAVDEAGASLRAFNLESAPKLQARLRQLREQKGWPEGEHESAALESLRDERTAALDAKSNDLLARIDALGRPPSGPPDCAKLEELKAAGAELMGVMRAKNAHLLNKIAAELGDSSAPERSPVQEKVPAPPAVKSTEQAAAAPKSAEPVPAAPRSAEPAPAPKPPAQPKIAAAPPPSAKPPPPVVTPPKPKDVNPKESSSWSAGAEAERDRAAGPMANVQPPSRPSVGMEPLPPASVEEDEESYTIEEVREATRGFFGAISTGLASVIEHAFRKSGRPTAYVLGQEGGGAFLAGLRYGSGTMYLRRGGTRPIYWHGPSLGTDFGASGSRTMFLIYNLHEPEAIYRSFSGIDGSAYLVGGVGITYLQGGNVVMAPIRSGLGLRVGASLGYIRFTPEASWNPF